MKSNMQPSIPLIRSLTSEGLFQKPKPRSLLLTRPLCLRFVKKRGYKRQFIVFEQGIRIS